MQPTPLPLQSSSTAVTGLRIYGVPAADAGALRSIQDWVGLCADLANWKFDTLLVPIEMLWLDETIAQHCYSACTGQGLKLMLDVLPPAGGSQALVQGLQSLLDRGGDQGLLLRGLAEEDAQATQQLLHTLRERYEALSITVWTPGTTPTQLRKLLHQPVDGVYSSLPWWNYRDAWLMEEYERLRAVAPVVTPLSDPRAPAPQQAQQASEVMRRLAVAALAGEALLVPGAQARALGREGLMSIAQHEGQMDPAGSGLRRLTGPMSPVTVLFRRDDGSRLLLLNPHAHQPAEISRSLIERRLPNGFVLASADAEVEGRFELAAGDWMFLPLVYADWIAKYGLSSRQQRSSLAQAMRRPRLAIESVQPVVDGGRFAAKRTLNESVAVQARIFMDGHDELSAELLWRPVNEDVWQHTRMRALGNDLWEARFTPRKLGRYVFRLQAWLDRWNTYCVQLTKKVEAGLDVRLEVEEGRRLLQAALEGANESQDPARETVQQALDGMGWPMEDGMARRLKPRGRGARGPEPQEGVEIAPAEPAQVRRLLDPGLAVAMARLDDRAFLTQTDTEYPVSVERNEVLFSSWYELFPRSQSPVPGQHGNFRDVIARLPEIRRMGFDVLYFPPIHPIGHRHRKGRNNSLQAGPGDPGSPYAIGSAEGGHDAVHPELGTLSDFRDLVSAAQQHGMEIALDFAIQCSPDHPWLREHPDWFNWRADGTLRHAENPPKRYEDIVNPDFYSPLASTPRQAALWRALRDIVIFWVHQGVRIFRVDNPHTKPLPFWEWMLREVRDRHPDAVFLSEAFARPAMMYRLAKLGFSQSYTYFTWRNTRQELTDYLTELNRPPVSDFFRPNFFVNTPDINPWFLQTSGRAGFLIRAVLAATLSGSWGMYNGFELCVAEAVPGKEEYLDSEKYQLRHWDRSTPGHIIEEITRLNRIRRSHPALQSHLGVEFHAVDNGQILFYSRHCAEGDSHVLVAVSLDPHQGQSGRLELPLDAWGMAEEATLTLHDLFEDRRFQLRGRWHHIELTPDRPFVIWARVPGGEG